MLSSLSSPCLPLNCSIAWDPDSRRFPLQAFGFSSPLAPGLSALLRGSPCTLKKKDSRHSSGALGVACLIPSEEMAGNVPSKTHLWTAFPPKMLSACSFQTDFCRGIGELGWMKELHQCFCLSQAYSSQTQVTLHKVHSESSFQRCKKMQATLSFSPSPPSDPRVNVFSAYQVKHEWPPSPASAYLRTDQKDQRAPRTVEFIKPRHNDTDNNEHCNKKHNSNYVPFFRKNREGEKVKNALRSQEDC